MREGEKSVIRAVLEGTVLLGAVLSDGRAGIVLLVVLEQCAVHLVRSALGFGLIREFLITVLLLVLGDVGLDIPVIRGKFAFTRGVEIRAVGATAIVRVVRSARGDSA